jgi:hypothetical protein
MSKCCRNLPALDGCASSPSTKESFRDETVVEREYTYVPNAYGSSWKKIILRPVYLLV